MEEEEKDRKEINTLPKRSTSSRTIDKVKSDITEKTSKDKSKKGKDL